MCINYQDITHKLIYSQIQPKGSVPVKSISYYTHNSNNNYIYVEKFS